MLNEYKNDQEMAYNLLVGDIVHNCVTHAYLIDENNYSDSYKMILSFVKALLCDNHCLDDSKCGDCSLCKRIDDGNYPEIKVIEADGMYIKKQQIIDLQQDFSRSAIEGKKRIYIIRECEKMRTEAANSMLKFLEEPDADIVAILMTNNINNVLPTIISRCKVVKLNNVSNSSDMESGVVLDDLAINFVDNLEHRGIDVIVSVKDIWFSVVGTKERDRMIVVFDRMIDIYYDVMKILSGRMDIKCLKFEDKIRVIASINSMDLVIEKINILLEAKDSIKFNVNSSLLMDSVIIRIGGLGNVSRC